MLDLDAELDRAEDTMPFSNSTDGYAWTDRWCGRCLKNTNDDCPLLTVALLGKTPFGWIEMHGQDLVWRYLCAEYQENEEPTCPKKT